MATTPLPCQGLQRGEGKKWIKNGYLTPRRISELKWEHKTLKVSGASTTCKNWQSMDTKHKRH